MLVRCFSTVPSGDLTHAKFPDERSSRQFQVEWDWYKEALERCGVREKVVWLDIRGNHGEGGEAAALNVQLPIIVCVQLSLSL